LNQYGGHVHRCLSVYGAVLLSDWFHRKTWCHRPAYAAEGMVPPAQRCAQTAQKLSSRTSHQRTAEFYGASPFFADHLTIRAIDCAGEAPALPPPRKSILIFRTNLTCAMSVSREDILCRHGLANGLPLRIQMRSEFGFRDHASFNSTVPASPCRDRFGSCGLSPDVSCLPSPRRYAARLRFRGWLRKPAEPVRARCRTKSRCPHLFQRSRSSQPGPAPVSQPLQGGRPQIRAFFDRTEAMPAWGRRLRW
jgi:hypothetical protein